MKKEFLLLCGCFLMALGGTVLTGCGEEEITTEPTFKGGTITLSDESKKYLLEGEANRLQITLESSTGQKKLSFIADTTWSIDITEAEWLNISTDANNGTPAKIERQDNNIKITGEGSKNPYNIYIQPTTPNEGTDIRIASIAFQTIRHQGNGVIEMNPGPYYYGAIIQCFPLFTQQEISVSYIGGINQTKKRSPSTYIEPKPSTDWIHLIEDTNFSTTSNFNFKVDTNDTGTERSGKIICTTYYNGYSMIDTLTIVQRGTKVEKQINVLSAGTLQEQIPLEEKYEITDLTLTGNLNGDDLRFIREMAGVDYAGDPTDGKLVSLDLSEANIVSEGKPYYSNYNASNNTVGHYLFSNSKLFSIILPHSITSFESNIFENCYNLTSIFIPDNIIDIWYSTFRNCISLTNITLPAKLGRINSSTFSGCKSLTSLNIPEEVTEIGREAFNGCEKLTELTLPASLETIEEGAFNFCTNLNIIHCQAAEPPLCSGVLGIEEHATLYVPKGTLAKYKDAASWKNFKEIIEE